ncbi:MAG TPA: BatD family protein [Polyangiaceae bacterium]|nr:BatD family protein [Polyangiaceae bacterium]
MNRLFIFLLAALIAFLPRELRAQSEPSVSASVQPNDVQVGEPFSIQLNVTTDASGPSASDPRLVVPEGLRASQPSVATQTQISFINGHLTRRSGLTATWQVVATREGVFGIAPPSAAWNGRRVQGSALRVKVHAPGAPGSPGSRRRAPSTPNPFDPFGMFPRFPNVFDTPESESPQPDVQADPEIAIDAPLDSKVFLRSVVDQRSPVVGEQVTLTVFIYQRMGMVEYTDAHEPSLPDFLRRELIQHNVEPETRRVNINGVGWLVKPIFKVALFPLRSGEIDIGPMQLTLNSRTLGLQNAVRASQTIRLRVSEPPSSGRPVGYQLGDVGAYSLSATVDPRSTEVGGAVGVTIVLGGVGNVPNAIRVPISSSVEWLEPQVRENIEVENSKVRGSRTFTYVVRPKTAGTLDLGAVTLPYWNPEHRAYETARAVLGQLQVAGNAAALNKDPTVTHDAWSALAAPRAELRPFTRARDPFTDKPLYWFGLFGLPVAVVMGSLGSRSMKRMRSGIAARRAGAERGIDKALAEARDAKKRGDRMVVAASLDRALYLAIERATGLRARALLLEEVPRALQERHAPAEVATETGQVLAAVEAFRFVPEGAPEVGVLVDQAAAVIRRLARLSPGAKA